MFLASACVVRFTGTDAGIQAATSDIASIVDSGQYRVEFDGKTYRASAFSEQLLTTTSVSGPVRERCFKNGIKFTSD